jgi:hypothetical protein
MRFASNFDQWLFSKQRFALFIKMQKQSPRAQCYKTFTAVIYECIGKDIL